MTNPQQPQNNPNQTSSIIDLGQIANLDKLDVDIKIKTQKSRADYILEFSILSVLSGIALFSMYSCFQIVNSKTASPDDKKNAQSIITSIIGGVAGFVAGRATNNKN
jgi:hypothetical protein